MATLKRAITADLTGYVPVEVSQSANAPTPSGNMQPGRSSMMRCPLPILGAATADALRSYYLDGQVPQVRLLTPQSTVVAGSSSSSTTTVVTSSSSSGTSSSSLSLVAAQATITSAVIGPNSKYTGVINLSKSFQLLSLTANASARVELYGSASAQSSDMSRGLDVAPGAGTAQNIICDVVLDTVPYQWTFQNRTGANGESPQTTAIYVTVTNLNTTSSAVTVTLLYVPLAS